MNIDKVRKMDHVLVGVAVEARDYIVYTVDGPGYSGLHIKCNLDGTPFDDEAKNTMESLADKAAHEHRKWQVDNPDASEKERLSNELNIAVAKKIITKEDAQRILDS